MKRFEITYLCLEPLTLPLHRMVRKRLVELVRASNSSPQILDVGGRKSHYTIGLPADVSITDLPRESEVQHDLHLGINEDIRQQVMTRRSNVRQIVYDDMTSSQLPDNSFDIIVSVEVLEHVEEDVEFVRQVARVLKPGGTFLMTTPNGDAVANSNPDHKRHYTRAQLLDLLLVHFQQADVRYAVRGGYWRSLGLRSWSAKRPWRTLSSMAGNVVNQWQSRSSHNGTDSVRTRHLMAEAVK